MKVMVMSHPVNANCREVLFCMDDSEKFSTVDGFSQSYIAETMGYNVQMIKRFSNTDRLPYTLMGKSLAEKITLLRLYAKYKDEYKYLKDFRRLAVILCDIQCELEEDLDLPEIVQVLANTPEHSLKRTKKSLVF